MKGIQYNTLAMYFKDINKYNMEQTEISTINPNISKLIRYSLSLSVSHWSTFLVISCFGLTVTKPRTTCSQFVLTDPPQYK
jgi:hypothetical protein